VRAVDDREPCGDRDLHAEGRGRSDAPESVERRPLGRPARLICNKSCRGPAPRRASRGSLEGRRALCYNPGQGPVRGKRGAFR
jgi:hypothetical protein